MIDFTVYTILLVGLLMFWVWELWLSHKFKSAKTATSLESLLYRHKTEPFVTLRLQPGSKQPLSWPNRRNLRPGDKVNLMRTQNPDSFGYDIYARGRKVGELPFEDSVRVESILKSRHVTGIYVWRQENQTPSKDNNLGIVLFYHPVQVHQTVPCDILRPYMLKVDARMSFVFNQN